MTPRDRLQRLLFEHRTDPIYNRCMICGQSGHCSAGCTQGRCNDKAQGADGGFIAGGSPGAAGSAARVAEKG